MREQLVSTGCREVIVRQFGHITVLQELQARRKVFGLLYLGGVITELGRETLDEHQLRCQWQA